MVKVDISGGICGFSTIVTAKKEQGYEASFQLETECPNWQRVNAQLGGRPLDMMAELFKDRDTGEVHSQVIDTALRTIPHVSCPVMSGILKALEVSVGLALPQDAAIRFVA